MSDTIYGDVKKFFATLGFLFTCLVLAIIGFFMNCVKEANHDGMMEGIKNADFLTAAFREGDELAKKKLLAACINKYDASKSIAQSGDSKVYLLSGVHVDGLPVPIYFQRTKMSPPLDPKEISNSVIYAIFRQPNVTEKVAAWLKKNSYKGEFKMEFAPGHGKFNHDTYDVELKKTGSVLHFSAYFESRGRLYMWNGGKVYDLSEGLTSEASGAEQHFRDQVKWLQSLGR